MSQTTCKYCQTPFKSSRLGTKFCRDKCRNDYKNRVRAYDNAIVQRDQRLAELEAELSLAKQALADYHTKRKAFEQETTEALSSELKARESYQKMLSLPRKELYTLLWQHELKKMPNSPDKMNLEVLYKSEDEALITDLIAAFKAKKERFFNSIKKQEIDRLVRYPLFSKDEKQQGLEDRIEELQEAIDILLKKQISLRLPTAPVAQKNIHLPRASKKDKQARIAAMKASKEGVELTGAEVRQMKFSTFSLSGQLGKFLGQLDRNMVAFALTGNSGAGKSYFSYELAKLFLDNHLKVKYYSLEEGVGQLTKDKLNEYGIGKELKVTAFATLDKIDQEAPLYDVIIIDSYSKISKDPEDYEILRQTHSQTLFVVIFQKTTGKTIRGGASITFNSSAIIDIQKWEDQRVAVMKKSRYGTTNWVYSITEKRIIEIP